MFSTAVHGPSMRLQVIPVLCVVPSRESAQSVGAWRVRSVCVRASAWTCVGFSVRVWCAPLRAPLACPPQPPLRRALKPPPRPQVIVFHHVVSLSDEGDTRKSTRGSRRDSGAMVGGAAVSEEVFPGFKFTVCSYVISLLRPEVIRELELAKHGLKIRPLDFSSNPMENGDCYVAYADAARAREELKRHFGPDVTKLLFIGYAKQDQQAYVKAMLDRGMAGGYELESLDEKEDQREAILAAEGLYVGGGNSFLLANELHKRG